MTKYAETGLAYVALTVAIALGCVAYQPAAHSDPVLGVVSPDRVFYTCLDGLVIVTVGNQAFYYHDINSGNHMIPCREFKHP